MSRQFAVQNHNKKKFPKTGTERTSKNIEVTFFENLHPPQNMYAEFTKNCAVRAQCSAGKAGVENKGAHLAQMCTQCGGGRGGPGFNQCAVYHFHAANLSGVVFKKGVKGNTQGVHKVRLTGGWCFCVGVRRFLVHDKDHVDDSVTQNG